MMQKYVTHRENLGLLTSGFPPNEAQRVIYLAADVDAREAQGTAVIQAQRAKIEKQDARIAELEKALSPRLWTREQSDAWHQNIPDLQAAFDALRAAT